MTEYTGIAIVLVLSWGGIIIARALHTIGDEVKKLTKEIHDTSTEDFLNLPAEENKQQHDEDHGEIMF